MSDVSRSDHFKYTMQVDVIGSQLCELSRRLHQELSSNTSYLVCLTDTVVSHSEILGRPERLGLNRQFFLPSQIVSVNWISKSREEVLSVSAGETDNDFTIEYRGPGVVNSSYTSYYSYLCAVSMEFNEFAHLYLRIHEWSRWTSPEKELQKAYFQQLLGELASAPTFEKAHMLMPRALQAKMAHASEDLLRRAWMGLRDMVLEVPIDPKYYQDA